jgi:hypothetical protein
MALTYDYLKGLQNKKKKKGDEEIVTSNKTTQSNKTTSNTSDGLTYDYLRSLHQQRDDIAPIKTTVTRDEKDEGLDFFKQSKAFEDGYDFGDITHTILGSAGDLGFNALKGVGNLAEGVGDAINYGISDIADYFGANDFANNLRAETKKNLTEQILGSTTDFVDQYSVFGKTSDSIAQGIGMMGAIIGTGGALGSLGLGGAGVSAFTTGLMGVSGVGSGMSEAYEGGATDKEARIYGVISGTADALSELMFGGLGKSVKALGISKGLLSADDMLAKKISSMFSNQIMKNVAEFGVKASAEGVEEVVAGLGQAIGKKITYMSEEDLSKIVKDEKLLEQFVVGSVTSGLMQTGGLVRANQNKTDFITGLNENEQKVVDKEVENRIAEQEQDGKTLSKKEKNKIYDEVLNALDEGAISIDTIESAIGGETYDNYKSTVDQEEALKTEFATLNKMKKMDMTGEQEDRRAELKQQLEDLKTTSQRDALRKQLGDEVYNIAKDSRLVESYNERARKGQSYEADLSKYDEKQKAIIQKAIDSGTLNNTRKTHKLVDMIAKISADKGVSFDFVNNEKLKETGFALEGKTVDGFVDNDGNVVINVNSPKYLNSVVGHEITHILEGTELYTELEAVVKQFATTKGEYANRMQSLRDMYTGVYEGKDFDEKIRRELTSDIVGEYLFTDEKFINNLSTEKPNLFKKIYDEIKYLCKVATAGSKEARELEKVKRAFEKAYKESVNTKADADTKYSLSSISNTFFGDPDMTTDEFTKADYKETQGYKNYVEQCVNNFRQTRADFDEGVARKEIEDSIDGIVRVAIASKKAGYDIYDDNQKRDTKDSKKRLLFSSLEPNSEYTTSNDISTICDKSKNFQAIYDDIVRREQALGVPKGKRFFDKVDNYFYLHKVLAEKGLTQPCRQCYVDSMRKNLTPMANAFLQLVQETNPNNKSNEQLYNKSGKNKGVLKENNSKIREKVLELLAEENMSANELTHEMLTTEDGLAELRLQHPMIYEAFNSFYGQSKPKMPKSPTPFRFGELTALLTNEKGEIKKSLVDKINSTGGFRLQSYSDFQIANYVDTLQVLFEAGTLGLSGHAYTKVPAFLDATEGTNLKRNISIFMYKDGDEWKIDKNDSFPYEIEEIYDIVNNDESGNTSIIAVSQNADMSAWIMANDYVGYGIPFHKSGHKMGTVRDTDVVTDDGRTVKGYKNAIDHTKQQTEVWAKTTADHKINTKVKKPINIYEFWDFNNTENLSKNELIEKNVKAYIDACNEAGYLPKFRDYVMNNDKVISNVLKYSKQLGFMPQDATIDDISFEYEGYRIPYGYYKFLGDFGMFTPDGKASPHDTLSLENYDFDKAEEFFSDAKTLRRNEILQQFSNGIQREFYRNSNLTAEQLEEKIKQKRTEVADSIVAPVKETKTRYSLSETDKTYLSAVEKGDTETAQRMVDEVAKENGYTVKVYHGTNQFGFTKFEGTEGHSYDEIQFFATDSLETANTYAGTDKVRKVSEKYELDDDTEYQYEKQAMEIASDLASFMSQKIGYYNYIDGEYIHSQVKNGNNDDITNIEDEWLFDIYKNEYADEYEEFYEFQESEECEELSNKFHHYVGQIDSLCNAIYYYNTSGIYEFVANTDNLFIIEGNGKHWNALEDSRLPDRIINSGGKDIKLKYKTRDVCVWAKRQGYSGVLFKNIIDSGSGQNLTPANVYAFFEPRKQVKSADAVTYDDNGNVIPLSERFKADNEDIRYSLSNENDIAPTRQGNLHITGDDVRLVKAPVGVAKNTTTTEDIAPTEDVEAPTVADSNYGEEAPIITTKQKISAKIRQSQTQLEKNVQLRDKSNAYYDKKIAEAQAKYDAKKNKDTKSANDILRSIANLERLKANRDAEFQKTINDIESRISRLDEQLLSNHDRADRLEGYKKRADARLEAEKNVLTEEFEQRKAKLQEELKDRDTYIKNKALELYKELNGLRKGVRASEELGYLLDSGYNWSELKTALFKVSRWGEEDTYANSEASSLIREAIGRDYDDRLYELDDLDNEFNRQVKKLEADAEKSLEAFKVANQRMTKQQEYSEQMEELAGDTSTWKDKKLGIQYKVNTLRRNLRDIVRDADGKRDIAKADAIYDELQGKYNHNEAELNRESNRIKKQFADMKITNAESTYIQMLGELRHNPDTELTEGEVNQFYEEHKKDIDEAKVDKAIEEARKLYDGLLERVNQVLSEQGMKEIPYRQGYFPHFTEDKQGILAKLFNWKTQNNDIPTDIAGLTENFNPNRSWQSFNKRRKGDTTDYNFLKGLDTYVQGSLDWIYHIEDIQKRRAFENHIRYVHSEKGIQEKIDAIRSNEEYDAEEMQEQIDIIYREASNPLNNFVSDFRTATNTLTGKKSSLDRGMEEMTNRQFYSTMTNLSNRVSANMVGGSISSALTNFVPITQSWGEVSPISSLRAMKDTIASSFRDDGTIDKSDFLTNRLRKTDNLYKTTWDKVGDGINILMDSIDNFTSQTVWRSKYLENMSKGMSENEAIKNADQFAENVIAGRSRGNQPTIFDSKNPLAKIFTVFQLEVNNQYGYMFKDMPQDMANETKAKLVKGYATMFLGAYVYNALYSSMVGRDVAFDPIGIIEDLLKDLGIGDDEEDEEIAPVNAIMGLTDNILEETPFIGGLLGGGRIPISSALPYGGVYEAYKGTLTDLSEGNTKSLTKEWLNPLYYLAMPMGGGQIRKTTQGLKMFDKDLPTSGSYTDSGNLRFPVEDNLKNRVQAGLFGQYANKNARAYFDNDIAPLKEKQINEYIDVDLPIKDYWNYRKGLSKFDKQDEKVDYINGLDVSEEQKNVLKSYLYDEEGYKKENPEKYEFLENEGIGFLGWKEADEETQESWSWAFKHQDEYQHYKANGVMPEDYSAYYVPMLEFDDESDQAYQWSYDYPEKATLGKAFSNGVKEYREYASALGEIRADKNANGKSISGSAKRKKLEYISNLDIDYGAKCILFRSQYTTDNSYNYDIINYLNEREDLTYDEKVTILQELDIEVDAEGNIYW